LNIRFIKIRLYVNPGARRLTSDEREDAQRHHQDSDHEIRDGQTHQEIISDVLQASLPGDRQAHQDISRGCTENQDQRQHRPPIVESVFVAPVSGGTRARRRQVGLAAVRGTDIPQDQRIVGIRQDDSHGGR